MTHDELFELRSAKPSFKMRMVEWVVSKRPAVFPPEADATREYLANRKPPRDAPMPRKFEQRFDVERWEIAGQRCVTLNPRSEKPDKHILYFHGGGFVFAMYDVHWPFVAKLVEETGASVTVPLYNVVPEHSHKDADALADAVFARLCETHDPANIILAGDSAGGHMAISLAIRLKRADGKQAGKCVLLSPWLDLTLADEAARAVEPKDVMLNIGPLRVMGEMWAGSRKPGSAHCSPLYANLSDLPPTAIFQGRHDLFVVDCRNYVAKARAAGSKVTLFEYAGAPHVYMIVPYTREAKDTMALICEFLDS
jgi:acetyl esterase/lipase